MESTTYTVEIEGGLRFGARATARRIDATLDDRRGWKDLGGPGLRRVAAGSTLRILVATPDTTDRLCAPLETRGRVSCRNADLVVINALRWSRGAASYDGDLTGYRRYVVNHEVGHAMGEGHVGCPGPGRPAPVMLQQTYGLQGCVANPWPTVGR